MSGGRELAHDELAEVRAVRRSDAGSVEDEARVRDRAVEAVDDAGGRLGRSERDSGGERAHGADDEPREVRVHDLDVAAFGSLRPARMMGT